MLWANLNLLFRLPLMPVTRLSWARTISRRRLYTAPYLILCALAYAIFPFSGAMRQARIAFNFSATDAARSA